MIFSEQKHRMMFKLKVIGNVIHSYMNQKIKKRTYGQGNRAACVFSTPGMHSHQCHNSESWIVCNYFS